MAVVCPTVLATTDEDFRTQMERVAPFARRIQIDLTDGDFAVPLSVKPDAVWWPTAITADIHLMFKNPLAAVNVLLNHRPHMIIFQAEAAGQFDSIAKLCQGAGVKVGLALLPATRPESIFRALPKLDHVLIFSGDLGKFGGRANLDLLRKAHYFKEHKPDIEIGWDGGVNAQNASQLVSGGVDVLNVGGAIQKADDPEKAFHILQRIADETGTT